MEIKDNHYQIIYDPASAVITCQGALRLYGAKEYTTIIELLYYVADQKPPHITLDVQGLQFLNSSGINVFCKFVIRVRDLKVSQLLVHGSQQFYWQGKTLINLQRLMPDLKLELE